MHTYDDEERCCFLYVLLPHVVLFFLFALRFQQLYSRSFKTGTWCTCDTAVTQKGPSPLHGTGRKSCVYRHNTWTGRWQCLFCNRSPYRSFSQNYQETMEASHTKLKSCQSFHGPSRAPPECRPYLQSHFELLAIVVSPSSNDHPYTCPLCMRPQIRKAGTANTAIPIIHHLRRPLPMCSFCGTIICNHI